MQPLTRRLATAPRQPWPAQPVPLALVITELDLGGAERALVALATQIDRRRWRPRVLALGPEGVMMEPLLAAGIECECLNVSKRRPAQAILALAEALRRQQPALVQSFLFHANLAAKLAAPLAGRPWVVGGIRVAERRKRWHLALDRATAMLSTGAICVSQGVLAFTRNAGGIDPARLAVIPNGIDPCAVDSAAPIPRAAIGVPNDSHLAVYIGRLDVQKGLPDLLEAAEQVIAARPDWHLAVVGEGFERDALRRRVAESAALSSHVHWLGRRGDVPGLLKCGDLLVLPSLWEGMPNVVLEAMAAHRAVVATAVEGSVDLVVPGATGWLVPAADPSALGAALLDAASDPQRLLRYGEAGRLRVVTEFSQSRTVAAYQELWARVLGYEFPPPGDP